MTWILTLLVLLLTFPAAAAKRPEPAPAPRCGPPRTAPKAADDRPEVKPAFDAAEVWSDGTVTVGGTPIAYCAAVGTLVVHPKDWDDAAPEPAAKDDSGVKSTQAMASMFYVAYFKRGAAARPLVFLFNGGPGSASLWLHMGAFGPRRVDVTDAAYGPAAPYRLVNNDHSLLDAADLVFIDAPGTGFSRIAGDDKEKSFYGVDEDAHAFARFIAAFLSKYKRWNSPRYLFGESYGTTRAAVLTNLLQTDPGVDFNGVIMLSQVLASGLFPDDPRMAPGNDLPYILSLPTFAATAWFHALPPERRAEPLPLGWMKDVEQFALGEYTSVLAAGAALDPAKREAAVAKLHTYTGLSPEYLRRADLRVGSDAFRQELLRERGWIVGVGDTRYRGYALDRTGKRADYDPTDAATVSAYVSTFNDYVRRVLLYGDGKTYRPSPADIIEKWNFRHQPPDADATSDGPPNTLLDLARAMKTNPSLKIQLNAGYFDLITPYFQGRYEMRHLPIPAELQANIEYRCYQAGHMPYLRPGALAALHGHVADFIARTSNLPASRPEAGPAAKPGTAPPPDPGCVPEER